jgi:outer membrane protein assembly factor BamB
MLPLGANDPRVIGEFHLHARLGAGGMGRVYLASSPGGRAVAVKVVHAHLARDAAFRDRFRHEVAAAQAVNSAYAAPVVAAGPDDDPPWLATAYVAGPSLLEAVTETGPLPEDAVVKLAAGLAEGLRVIHDGGLVHRDLKPGNVLLADDGPRVIDFGIARALDGTGLTSAGSVLGTPSFMSPEQAQGQPAGPASDVFSLGGVVYFAATGAGPFGTAHPAVMLYRIVHTDPDLDRLPPGLRDLAAACLAKDPDRRPTPVALADSLMDAPPPGDTPPAFWPAPVARLIADHQARFAAGLMAGGRPSPEALTVPVAPAALAALAAPATPAALATPATPATPPLPADPATPPRPADPATPPRPADPATPPLAAAAGRAGMPPAGAARPGRPEPVPGMTRRRALAALAGAASAGLVVGAWELTRPGAAAAGNLPAQSLPSSARPGTKLWSYQTNGTVASVVAADGVVYAGTLQRAVYAFNALTGTLLWRHLMGTGKTWSLATADGLVFAADGYNGVAASGYGGGVYALDARTGTLQWTTASPLVVGLAAAGGTVYAGVAIKDDLTGGVTALSAGTGEVLWTFDFPTNVDIDGGIWAADGAVYVNTGMGEIYALDGTNGNVLWRFADPKVTFPSGLGVNNGVLYTSSGQDTKYNTNPVVYAFEARTGRQLWQHPVGVAPYSAGWDVGSGLFFGLVDRSLITSKVYVSEMFALNAATGQQVWNVPLAAELYAVTAGPNNAIYTSSGTGAFDAWQADTGNHLWTYRAAGTLDTLIVLHGGVAYFGSTDHRIYAVVAQS